MADEFVPPVEEPAPPTPLRRRLIAMGFWVLMIAAITLLFLAMRGTLGVGGFCATGGPYEIRAECPPGAAAAAPLGVLLFFVGFIGYLVMSTSTFHSFMGLPLLFYALGWNFLEFGIRHTSVIWLLLAGMFFVMGGGPWLVRWLIRNPRGFLLIPKFGVDHALGTVLGCAGAVGVYQLLG